MSNHELPEKEIIWGLHSIVEALNNPLRRNFQLYFTNEGATELKQKMKNHPGVLERIASEVVDLHGLNMMAEKWCKKLDFQASRVPSQVFLVVDPLPLPDLEKMYKSLDKAQGLRVVCLDQVTDAHNAGAIARTCSFFGVKTLIIPQKGSFGLSPNFYRIASGSLEHIQLFQLGSLPRFLNRLDRSKNLVIGLSEHADNELQKIDNPDNKNLILILGAEDRGLSYAVQRILDARLSLHSQGAIKSLNVSVAAALAMQRVFIRTEVS